MEMNAEQIAQSIVRGLKEMGAVFPVVALAGNDSLLPIVHELVGMEAADMHLSGIDDVLDIINAESHHTLVYLSNQHEADLNGEATITLLRRTANFVANVNPSTGNLQVFEGNTRFPHLPVPGHTIARKFLYMPEFRMVYGVVNKCGNTFLGKALTGLDSEAAIGARFSSMEHMREIFSRTNDVYKFTVVRNPYSRLVSVYLDIICGQESTPSNRAILYRRALGLPVSGNITFDAMVSRIEKQGFIWGPGHEHWVPQTVVSCMGSIKYDAVGRLEDLSNFLETHIVPTLLARGDTRKNIFNGKPDRKSGASDSWTQFYVNSSIRNRVYNLYEMDFDVLRYSKWID